MGLEVCPLLSSSENDQLVKVCQKKQIINIHDAFEIDD